MKKFKCPMFDLDCPYCSVEGECTIGSPIDECDDFAFFWDKDDDYICEDAGAD